MCMYSYFSLWGLLLFFCLDTKEKITKEKIKAALFWLLQSGIPLKKNNSLRSNSFFFLTFHPSPSASRQKSEAYIRRNIASLVGVNGKHPPQTAKRIIHPWKENHSTNTSTPNSEVHWRDRKRNILPIIDLKQRSALERQEEKHPTNHPPQTAKRI